MFGISLIRLGELADKLVERNLNDEDYLDLEVILQAVLILGIKKAQHDTKE